MRKYNWYWLSFILVLWLFFGAFPSLFIANAQFETNNAEEVPLSQFSLNDSNDIIINEVLYFPASGNYEWVEIKNSGDNPQNITGYKLTDEDDNVYVIPDVLPDIPSGAFVIVIFDGLGATYNDYDFTDNVAILHTPPGLVDVFEDGGDQCALYQRVYAIYLPLLMRDYTGNPVLPNPKVVSSRWSPLVDFVAWGIPPDVDGITATTTGLWVNQSFINITQMPGNDGLRRRGSLGVHTNRISNSLGDWISYLPEETSEGEENPIAGPHFRNPPNDMEICEHQLYFGWTNVVGATAYKLEIADNIEFNTPLVSEVITDTIYQPTITFPDGTFYFRVKSIGESGQESIFSNVGEVSFIDCSGQQTGHGVTEIQALLGVTPILQHKDTHMLCLGGCPESGMHRWDSAHEDDADWIIGNGNAMRGCPLDDNYCTRAAMAMIITYHGGNLSQDRISYYGYEGQPIEGQLGYGHGLWPNEIATHGTGRNVFDWAMNNNAVTSSRGKPTYAQVKLWINDDRPILIVENNDAHSVVLDGYWDLLLFKLAHRVDPWTATSSWVRWNPWDVTEYHVAPAGILPRSDEDLDSDGIVDTVDDSDNDGICDFDEQQRFDLDYLSMDSDLDLILDKLDMREYVFDNAGNFLPSFPDFDNDGLRKELDPDNDNGGSIDGCEDFNLNGKLEIPLGESNNFFAGHERICPSPLITITGASANSSNCMLAVEGVVSTTIPLLSLTVNITHSSMFTGDTYILTATGTLPNLVFTQTIGAYEGSDIVIDVVVRNNFGFGIDTVTVTSYCTQLRYKPNIWKLEEW